MCFHLSDRTLKQRHFWAMQIYQNCSLFPFNMLQCYQICIAKLLYPYKETICLRFWANPLSKNAKCLFLDDMHRSKMPLLKPPSHHKWHRTSCNHCRFWHSDSSVCCVYTWFKILMHKADMGSKILKQATKEGEKLRDSFRRFEKCHIRVEFVVGSLLCSKRFSSQYSGFPLSSETNISKFQFHQALLGELCVSLVWISKPVVSRIKEEAMLLLVFTIVFALFSVAVAV